jgi:predicted TIM-barrel fold metal-dependent hydrolase
MFDGHIHIRPGKAEPESLIGKMHECGIEGGILISLEPVAGSAKSRIENLKEWTVGFDNLVPFYWIDPLEDDAERQVVMAADNGAAGLKIICDRFYPGDERCLSVCSIASEAGLPVLFHSGILWDGKPSSEFCRPVHFESLFAVDNLRFSLAHIGWPWCDEMVAVYGKFLNFLSRNPGSKTEMFIDLTPGTPEIYRREAIRKLLLTGYDLEKNIIFGTDCDANAYNAEWTCFWISTDREIYSEIGIGKTVAEDIFINNAKRFMKQGEKGLKYRNLKPAEL